MSYDGSRKAFGSRGRAVGAVGAACGTHQSVRGLSTGWLAGRRGGSARGLLAHRGLSHCIARGGGGCGAPVRARTEPRARLQAAKTCIGLGWGQSWPCTPCAEPEGLPHPVGRKAHGALSAPGTGSEIAPSRSQARRDDVHEVRAGPDVQAGGAALHLGHHYVLGPADAAGLRQQGGQAHEHLPQPPQASLSSQVCTTPLPRIPDDVAPVSSSL